MAKIAFVFPGQGSQYVGMGKDLSDKYPKAAEMFATANAVLGFDLTNLCFNGPEEELQKTVNTQPAILAISSVCQSLLDDHGIKAQMMAGHSLGEYSALVGTGVLDFRDALRLVRIRGKLMEEAASQGFGGMAAILGLDSEKTKEACQEVEGVVEPVNFNCPGQIVIAGENKALDQALVLAKAKGAKRAVRLAVSGPFHSSLMKPVGEKLALELEKINFSMANLPIVANVDGSLLTNPEDIKMALVKQVCSPVQWEKSIKNMIGQGIDTFVEVGPGKVLSGLIKKIDKSVTLFNVEDGESLAKTIESL